jgi:hypothetical protein
METQGIKKYRLDSPAGGLTQRIMSEVLNGFDSNVLMKQLELVAKNFESYWDIFGVCPRMA